MTRAVAQVGLAVAIVFAPAFCCCKLSGLGKAAQVSHVSTQTPSAPVESCCLKAKKTCCDETANTTHDTPKPASPRVPACACCEEQPAATLPESAFTETLPQPIGEYLALAGLLCAPEHRGIVRGFHQSDRAGVDARCAALFERHVLRC